MLIIGMEVAREAGAVVQWAQNIAGSGARPPAWLSDLPLVGARLSSWWRIYMAGSPNTADLSARLDVMAIVEWARTLGSEVAWRLTTLALTLLILFFIYRDGDKFIEQAVTISDRLFGRAGRRLGASMVTTVRETVNGQLFVALGEGFILGIAYAVCGLPHPLLLGALTVVLAIIPFGAPVLVATASLILLIQSSTIQAFGLLMFGSIVFLAEYFVRPLLIGSSARLLIHLGFAGDFRRSQRLRVNRPFPRSSHFGGADCVMARARDASISLADSMQCLMPAIGSLSAVRPSPHTSRTNIAVIDPPPVNLTKRNQTPPAFVPKRELYALEALKQRKSAHATKFGMLAEHPRQTVTGNTAAQVMDMVDADVCCEPAQDSRKVIVRTAVQSRFLKAPPILMRPECRLELMLHVEQPYSH